MQQLSVDSQGTFQEDLVLQQRTWRAHRIGWIILIVLLLCALNGLLG